MVISYLPHSRPFLQKNPQTKPLKSEKAAKLIE